MSMYCVFNHKEVFYFVSDYPFGGILRSYENTSANQKFKFTGKERDNSTGLDYFEARFFDSEARRFVSVDPHANSYEAWSSYAFTFDNPLKFTDPTGMDPNPQDDKNKNKKKEEKTAEKKKEGDGNKNDEKKNKENTQNKAVGFGVSLNVGGGLFMQGYNLSVGAFGQGPGQMGQVFFTVGAPKNPLYLDASASVQFLTGYSETGNFDLSGDGRGWFGGWGANSASYSEGLDSKGKPTNHIAGYGPGIGVPNAGGWGEGSSSYLMKEGESTMNMLHNQRKKTFSDLLKDDSNNFFRDQLKNKFFAKSPSDNYSFNLSRKLWQLPQRTEVKTPIKKSNPVTKPRAKPSSKPNNKPKNNPNTKPKNKTPHRPKFQ